MRIKCVAAKVEEGPSRGDWALLSPLLRSGTGGRAWRWGEDEHERGEAHQSAREDGLEPDAHEWAEPDLKS